MNSFAPNPGAVHRLLSTAAVLVALGVVNAALRRAFAPLPDHGRPARMRLRGRQAGCLLAAAEGPLS